MASLTTGNALAKHSHGLVAGRNLPCKTTSSSVVQLSVQRPSVSIHRSRSALSWANSRGFGKTISVVVRPMSSQEAAAVGPTKTALQVKAFTPEQSKLVKESWKLVQKDDAGKWAVKFFLKVFEIAPSVKRMFSFLNESSVPIEKNPKLKVHALQVFTLTGQAATQLGEKGGLDALIPKLIELGDSHVTYGVVDEHFDVVKFALLTTLGEALPEQWNAEAKEAWSTAYDAIVSQIKAEMARVKAHPTAPSLTR